MTPVEEQVVTAYAQLGAVHEPIQNVQTPLWAVVWILRKEYPARGLPWRGQGSKEAETILWRTVHEGFLVRRRGVRQTTGVRLTTEGIRHAWGLLGWSESDALLSVRQVAALGGDKSWYVPESTLSDGDRSPGAIQAVAAVAGPALVMGWLETNTCANGLRGYRVTQPGRVKIAETPEVVNPPEVTADPAALEVFRRVYAETLYWLDSLTPTLLGRAGEMGECPLSTAAFVMPREPRRRFPALAVEDAE